MSKKNRQKINKKSLIEFEMKNAEETAVDGQEKTEEIVEKADEGNAHLVEIGKEEIIEDKSSGDVSEMTVVKKERNKKYDTYIELALVFILGVLIGVAFKTEAEKRITIGFDDYKMSLVHQDFDLNQLQFEVTKKDMEQAKSKSGSEDSSSSEDASRVTENGNSSQGGE